jgi:hypothetical protein
VAAQDELERVGVAADDASDEPVIVARRVVAARLACFMVD